MSELLGKIAWILVLLPGFFSLLVARLLSPLGEFSEFEMTVISLALAGLNLGSAALVSNSWYKCRNISVALEDLPKRPAFVGSVLLISLASGILIAIAHDNDAPTRVTRFFFGSAISQVSYRDPLGQLLRTAGNIDSPEFPDARLDGQTASALAAEGKIERKALRVYLRDAPDEPILGFTKWWGTEGGKVDQIYMSPVCLVLPERTCRLAGPGVWISVSDILRIDFVDAPAVPCLQEQLPPVDKFAFETCH